MILGEVSDPAKSSATEQTVLSGRYVLRKAIGTGASGTVFLAHDTELGETGTVAIKILNPMLSADQNGVQRFKREILLARELSHPNIVRVHTLYPTAAAVLNTMEQLVLNEKLPANTAKYLRPIVAGICGSMLLLAAISLPLGTDNRLFHARVSALLSMEQSLGMQLHWLQKMVGFRADHLDQYLVSAAKLGSVRYASQLIVSSPGYKDALDLRRIQVNHRLSDGSGTLLHHAIRLGKPAFVRALVKHGAKVQTVYASNGVSPLQEAIALDRADMLRELVNAYDFNKDRVDATGTTPIQQANGYKRSNLLPILLGAPKPQRRNARLPLAKR